MRLEHTPTSCIRAQENDNERVGIGVLSNSEIMDDLGEPRIYNGLGDEIIYNVNSVILWMYAATFVWWECLKSRRYLFIIKRYMCCSRAVYNL